MHAYFLYYYLLFSLEYQKKLCLPLSTWSVCSFRNKWCLCVWLTWLGALWWLLEENWRPAAPVCDAVGGAAVVWILSAVCLPETIRVSPRTVSIWGSDWRCDISDYPEGKYVWNCTYLHIWPLSGTRRFSIFFHFSFSPDTNVPPKALAALLGLFNGQNM